MRTRLRSVFNTSFRSLESLLRMMYDILWVSRVPYTSKFKRVRKIKVPMIYNLSASIAVVSTGFKTTLVKIGFAING